MLVCVDGLSSYVTAFCRAFEETVPTGKRGSQPKQLPASLFLGQVIKNAVRRRVLDVAHRAVIGSLTQIEERLQATGGGQVLNTAFVERLNGTFRSRLVPLVRRGRCLARKETTLQAGMYLVGAVYNFCGFHDSLRLPAPAGGGRKWQERTPAMAAGPTGTGEMAWQTPERGQSAPEVAVAKPPMPVHGLMGCYPCPAQSTVRHHDTGVCTAAACDYCALLMIRVAAADAMWCTITHYILLLILVKRQSSDSH